MLRIKIRRPSPALVVAVLALFVALSGTAYAAATLAKNSVGTAQLKNGAVTLTKIAASAQGELKPRAWAYVKGDGSILAGRGFSGDASHTPNSGIYDLTLSKPGSRCAAIAAITPGSGGSVTGGNAQASVSSGTDLQVHTAYFSSGFNLADERFSVIVYC
jgi:hypothetical protein